MLVVDGNWAGAIRRYTVQARVSRASVHAILIRPPQDGDSILR